jgi:ribosomal protein S18 acetylase RimI-like enzyme
MSIEVVSPTTHKNKTTTEGLSFEVRECDGDHVYTPRSPTSPVSPASDLESDDDSCRSMLMRSESSSVWNEPAPSPAPAPEDVKDANISRVQMGDNPETVALLHFLTSQGIDTTKLVTEHLMKYGSRIRIAQTDEGTIIGCLVFDNETDQSELRGMTPEEVKKRVGPFIYMQLLVVAPEHAMDSSKRWKERLLASFLECVVKNGKIAIVRADADNISDIKLYQSCGFFTMEDMGIPSYSSVKGNMEILAYTPMGLEDTSQLFKKFYDMGARF